MADTKAPEESTEEKTPAPKKKVLKKKRSARANIIKTEDTPVRDLNVYHKNPRVGDIESIANSLERNGQYRTIVVNIGTNAEHQMEVLAGNHTFLAARRLGWQKIKADFVDVDDERARAIVLADNKTAENGTYDEKIMGELLSQVPDIVSTGFKFDEAQDLIQSAGLMASNAVADIEEAGGFDNLLGGMDDAPYSEDDEVEDFTKSLFTPPEDDGYDPDTDDPDTFIPEAGTETPETDEITNKPSDLPGVTDLAPDLPEDPKFWSGYLQLPRLRQDMFMKDSEWPTHIQTWAGSATRDSQPDDLWWWYPWGGDSTKGLIHTDQVIVNFFSWDQSFEGWYWQPSKYAGKLINSGIKYSTTPDFSMWTAQSKFLNVWSLYRDLYVGRYLQEIGIKIIPTVEFPTADLDFLENFYLKYMPKGAEIMTRQTTTFLEKEIKPVEKTAIKMERMWVEHYQPKRIVLYGPITGRRWFQDNIMKHYPEITLTQMPARIDLVSEWKKSQGLKKKTGI
jgi:ParB-like chromosome segregation protein Spo0J